LRNLGSTPDVIACRCAIEKDFKFYFSSSGQAVVVSQPVKDMQTELFCVGSAKKEDTEHNGSNERRGMNDRM